MLSEVSRIDIFRLIAKSVAQKTKIINIIQITMDR